MKIRLGAVATINILIVVICCEAGQMLVDETSCVFDTLMKCSWYNWDFRNKQILLIFQENCLKPFKMQFVSVTMDCKLAGSLLKTATSYALVLHNLRQSNYLTN
ncbi:unnamed protein product [Tenebrio molitor]|nr:unnamed protein product [Tenebrio molitor]